MYPEYSVLMSVYAMEQPESLHISIESMIHQNVPPSEIIIICDGPLTVELEEVLTNFKNNFPSLIKIYPFAENKGLGNALRAGVLLCNYEYILRMDTDDFSVPQRSQLQLEAMTNNENLVVLGGQILEFEEHATTSYAKKKVPLTDSQIRNFSRKRNPFNHMSVCYKRSAVIKAGNYLPMLWFEDYWLWMRLLKYGQGENLDHVLVHASGGKDLLKRRGGVKYLKPIWAFQRALYTNDFQGLFQYLFNSISRSIVALIPGSLRAFVYNRLLRTQETR